MNKKKAWFDDKTGELIIICPFCNIENACRDIPNDEWEKYSCYKCKKRFYCKSKLVVCVKKNLIKEK